MLGAVKHSALGFLAFHPACLLKVIPHHFHEGALLHACASARANRAEEPN